MFLQKLDKYFFRWRWIIYLFGIFFIIYFDKFNLNLVFKICLNIFLITMLWIIFIFIPRYYFMFYIKKMNVWLFDNYIVIFKLRYEIINLPYYLKIILSYFLYIDRLLRIIFFIDARHDKVFYFIRLFIYLNLYLWLLLPFYLIEKFLFNVYYFFILINNKLVSILHYFLLRIDFVIMSIIFMLLFGISRIDFIILIWIIDEIINLYYLWIQSFFLKKKEFCEMSNIDKNSLLTFMAYSNILKNSFCDLKISFKLLMIECNNLMERRLEIILLFFGVGKYVQFMFKYKYYFNNYWNSWLFLEYDRINMFIDFLNEMIDKDRKKLYIIVKLFYFFDNKEWNEIKQINVLNLFLNKFSFEQLNNYFEYRYIYLFLNDIINKIINNEQLFNDINVLYKNSNKNFYLLVDYKDDFLIVKILKMLDK